MQEKTVYDWDINDRVINLLPVDTHGIVMKLSGGADSSILYYQLCKELSENKIDIPIYVATLDTETKPWYSHYAKKVINFVNKKTGILPVEHNIKFLKNPWTIEDYDREQDNITMKVIKEKKANVMIGGVTQNPEPEQQAKAALAVDGIVYKDYESALQGSLEKDFSRDDHTKKYVRTYDGIHLFYGIFPFIHKNKKQSTAYLYLKNNAMEDLFPLTYSCELRYDASEKVKLQTIIRDEIYEQAHCGSCWFCLERAFAFGRLV